MLLTPIENIVNGLPGEHSFYFGTANELNEAADRINVFPVYCLYPLHPVTLTPGLNSSVGDEYDIYMEILKQTKFEKNSRDNESLVNDCLLSAKKLIVAFSEYVAPGDTMRFFDIYKGWKANSMPVYYSKDANLVGVSLTCRLKTRNDEYLLNC